MQKVMVGVVVGGVVLFGGWYLMSADSREMSRMQTEKATMEEKALMEKKEMMENEATIKEDVMQKDATIDDGEAMKKDDMMADSEVMEKDTMMKGADEMTKTADGMVEKVGVYAPYEASKLAMANDGDVVLFFKASWCPSCRALDTNLKASLAEIPEGLTILEVDYDAAQALRQQYGVTTQHTLVQVDARGTLIKKWSGGSTLASIVAEVQ